MRILRLMVIGLAAALVQVMPAAAQAPAASGTPTDVAAPPASTEATGTGGTLGVVHGTTTTPPADYRIVPGDKLRVEVYRDQQLSQSLQVRPDGKITLPLLGDVQAAGTTPTQLRDTIATSLKEYVTNPVVTVIVVETVAPTVYVMGEVTHPGSIAIQGSINVMQALAMAGGFRDFADTKNIRVLRKTAKGTQTLKFNYKNASKGDGEMLQLQPGDTVIVP